MKHRAVLFDLDGTLLDTLEDLADAMNAALAAAGFPTHSVERYRYFVGDGMETLAKRVVPADVGPDVHARLVSGMREVYGKSWDRKTRPYDGIPEMLDALAARGPRLTILSNKPDDFTKMIVARMLSRWRFDVVLGARGGVPKKPDPAAALELAALIGVTPAEVLYLGDTGTDMRTAVAAGMTPVGALWGFRTRQELEETGARHLVARPGEVIALL